MRSGYGAHFVIAHGKVGFISRRFEGCASVSLVAVDGKGEEFLLAS